MKAAELEYNPSDASHRAGLAVSLSRVLSDAGFTHSLEESTSKEEVWTKTVHTDERVLVKVYSTIGYESWTHPKTRKKIMIRRVRSKGTDAIRVCSTITFGNGYTKGYAKTTRTNRAGSFNSIGNRMLKRMRSIYLFSLKRIHDDKYA